MTGEPLITRGVYVITSRNLSVGVYIGSHVDADGVEHHEFIGIREKFGRRFLSKEYGWNPQYVGMIPDSAQLTLFDFTLRKSLGAFEQYHSRKSNTFRHR